MGIYNVTEFGAAADGKTNCASAIQAAVNAAHRAGGGVVLLPAGRYFSGSILLKSNVELRLETGAVLISSLREDDILPFPADPAEGPVDGWNGGFFLGARDAENITLSGQGIIDGQGGKVFRDAGADRGFHECPKQAATFRPRMILFENVRNLTVRDVTLRDAAFWTLHMAGCRHVRIHDIQIHNDDRGANNDGIDPDCCQDVVITGCLVHTGDDAVVLKSTAPMARRYGPCENVIISSCILHSRDSALKIGTETHGTIRNVILSDCVVKDCSRGVGIWVRDGGTAEHIHVRHLTGAVRRYADAYDLPGAPGWWGKGEPVFISATPRKGRENDFPGVIRDITVSDLDIRCESCIFLGGEQLSPIERVRLRDIHITFEKQGTQPGGLFDEQPSARHIYPHSIPALYARHVRGLWLKDSSVRFCGDREAWNGGYTQTEFCENTDVSWDGEEKT